HGTGASVNFTYPVTALGWNSIWGIPLEDLRIGADYRIERATISNVGFDAPVDIREAEGTSTISSITPRISRNTLNHFFDPTAGSAQDFSVEIAGLGGERFIKADARTRWYYTFLHSKTFGDFTYSLGATGGYGVGDTGVNGDELPLFERYFPGGINSIRGFEPGTMGPRQFRKNTRGQAFTNAPVGGTSQIILNNEVIFPLVQSIGLKGVVFIDAVNAYGGGGKDNIDDARHAAGRGVRWPSPPAPPPAASGIPLHPQPPPP